MSFIHRDELQRDEEMAESFLILLNLLLIGVLLLVLLA
jgi:hypothetical protein